MAKFEVRVRSTRAVKIMLLQSVCCSRLFILLFVYSFCLPARVLLLTMPTLKLQPAGSFGESVSTPGRPASLPTTLSAPLLLRTGSWRCLGKPSESSMERCENVGGIRGVNYLILKGKEIRRTDIWQCFIYSLQRLFA